jgi:hypothetical protein
MRSSRLFLSISLAASAALTASVSEACPYGVSGVADPGATVCAQPVGSSALYCDVADASGYFYITGGAVPPSTPGGCLPAYAQMTFFEVGCPQDGYFIDRSDPDQQFGGSWLDVRCHVEGCGPGHCERGVYCDGCACYPPDSPISFMMCQCDLLDPTCGVGSCQGGAYIEGDECAYPVGYPPSSLVSQVMCGGVEIDPTLCNTGPCEPYSSHESAGRCDSFATADGPESSSPSLGLLAYIASVYWVPGSRDFDDVGFNQWFGHTFTGLTPQNGSHICGAKLTATIGHGAWDPDHTSDNDSLGLLFVDNTGTPAAASYSASLLSYGIGGGSSGTVTLDIGSLPGGAAMLAEMENGWLDFIVQDDHAVDCLSLDVQYCCNDAPDGDTPPSSK